LLTNSGLTTDYRITILEEGGDIRIAMDISGRIPMFKQLQGIRV
jgi:hypothetical protein